MFFRDQHSSISTIHQSVLLIIGLIGVSICSSEMATEGESVSLVTEGESCRVFSSKLYQVITDRSQGNIISSPLSIHVILSFLSHGAGGETLTEILSGLYVKDHSRLHTDYQSLISALNIVEKAELHLANAVFLHHHIELLTSFSTIGTKFYNFVVPKIDFHDSVASAQQINQWVSDKTNDKIQNIISSDDINDDTRVILVNAIYFKGAWKFPFDTKDTVDRTFHVNDNLQRQLPTMKNKKRFKHGPLPDLKSKFLEIPYVNETLSMVILLPDEIDGLDFLEKNFNWDHVINAESRNREIILHLPKFKIECTIDLKEVLREIGVKSIFENAADFSLMTKTPLKVSKVIQKAFIEVNEQGSEAAAATVMQIRLKRAIENPDEFNVDRPFMLVIRHKPSNIPLFIGSVRDIEYIKPKDEL